MSAHSSARLVASKHSCCRGISSRIPKQQVGGKDFPASSQGLTSSSDRCTLTLLGLLPAVRHGAGECVVIMGFAPKNFDRMSSKARCVFSVHCICCCTPSVARCVVLCLYRWHSHAGTAPGTSTRLLAHWPFAFSCFCCSFCGQP